jgi:hypothetical protein
MSSVAEPAPGNPFVAQGNYSAEAIELMRALRNRRTSLGQHDSSPEIVLETIKDLGYRREGTGALTEQEEARLFSFAVQRFQQQKKISFPTCEDVLDVIRKIGYRRASNCIGDLNLGLPIDRRRHELDARDEATERRASLELSAQQQMELSDEEHGFLDALKNLRERTGREFASSEELLNIIWSLGYRPVSDDGFPCEWLGDEERCRAQVAFTSAVENRLCQQEKGEFLSCRSLLQIAGDIGFRRV